MNLIEIMTANGVEQSVAEKITADMKANKIFTAGEDNLDIRYGKLKTEHAQAQQSISNLQQQIAELEQLKQQLDDANKNYATLEAENNRIKLDNALERASDDTDFCPFVKLVLAIWNDDKVARLVG